MTRVVRGDATDVFSTGFICPKGGVARARCTTTRTGCARRSSAATASSSRSRGTRRSRRSTRACRRSSPSTAATPSAVYLGNPSRAQPRGAALRPRLHQGARLAERLQRLDASTRCPSTCRPGSCSAAALTIPVPDLDRTMHLLVLGANPLASNGSLMTAPDARGRLRGDPRARRQGRRGRPAPLAHGRARRRAPLHPPGHRRAAAVRAGHTCCSRRACVDAGAALRRASTRSRALRRAVHARGRRRPDRHRRRRDPPHGARARRRRARRRLRPHRHDDRGVRDARELARRRPQRADGQPRPRGRRDVPARRRRADATPSRARRRAASAPGRWTRRVRGLPEVLGELPVATLADEIETPGEGQIRALITISRQPVPVDAELRRG